MGVHRVYLAGEALAPGEMRIAGDEAQHAVRVKRVEQGEAIEILNGEGAIARASVLHTGKDRGEWAFRVRIDEVLRASETRPRIEAFSAPPKGPRIADLVDGVSQAGAASWGPLRTARGESESRDSRLERLQRTAIEASKQCGRAWALRVLPELAFKDGIARAGHARLVVADASGGPYQRCGAETIRLLIGPEGGWTREELDAARGAGASICRFGPHVMRIETACAVACACILQEEAGR
jgi:16S rRNA (uracil1498-N3)-methyltransferase